MLKSESHKRLQTFELDGAQNQSFALVFRQASGRTGPAALTAAGIGVIAWTYQDFALNVH